MWIEARLRDRASGRELTVLTTHLSVEASLTVFQAREIVRRAEAAAAHGPVILAGDMNVPAGRARGRDVEAAALLSRLRDMGDPKAKSKRRNIDYVLASGFEPVSSRLWTGDSLQLPGSPDAEAVSDHYPEDDVLRYADARPDRWRAQRGGPIRHGSPPRRRRFVASRRPRLIAASTKSRSKKT